MSKLLLVSSSRVHGTDFLEHCRDAWLEHFSGRRLLFVPYALQQHAAYRDLVASVLEPAGIPVTSIHEAADPVAAVEACEGLFIGGGNSFRLLKTLYDLQLIQPIREAVLNRGIPYMGSSAGTNMACPTLRTTNDMPIVEPPSFETLNLVPFQINPHFLDADPDSTHQGETRDQRLTEFLEENQVPVWGLREGSWLEIHDQRIRLAGTTGMKLFQQGKPPEEISAGDVSHLLALPTRFDSPAGD